MADADIPSISSGPVGSRFVSQTELDQARENREAQWKAAYARLGQEPPAREDAEYDGRSLYEQIKQDEWEAKNKLSNQFRALEEDEVLFLDAVREEQRAEERARQDKDSEEVQNFKAAVAAREKALTEPPIPSPIAASETTVPANHPVSKKEPPPKLKSSFGKKDQKALLKGIIKKKTANAKSSVTPDESSKAGEKRAANAVEKSSDGSPDAKRSKKGET
ncbi:N-terminal domain of NEFA-interacting nuclear protein NIP30-domain-containing protein [Cantharellus anzutake]|uniref:N-terminal domain of NEFA-interacting nuclear protein NIP30-domain-containing protein n=1 Tax=Cantharellus anzutake TaxID=1750568 RepID=UPI00190854CD|nr:N-terminal domain of NEFA-interacting nuclear protein NIP30-domain-containing protein [Cantharellus anzutake]KAF8337894.1 N-terminal domain of NEFA-interacting nuclear protein NIP30-domain-containing protein [Cantharellus anzutake]